jgi:ABC-type antimicrobial peptide transport system permease subunit
MDPEGLVAAMERELRTIDPALPTITAKTMQRQLDDSLVALEVAVGFLGGLALVGLTLACVGLYAVVSFAVAQRSREVGIRTALGGRPGQVTWAISRDVAKLLFAAVGAATLVALVAVRILGTFDFSRPAAGVHLNVPTIDAGTLPFVAALLLAVGLVATWLPARRAAKADCLSVLRHE